MILAIHKSDERSFSKKWIEYCEINDINYKLVDCYSTNIIQDLSDCNILMWHWKQTDYKGILFARQLVYSLELMGKKVFPNSRTCWHFDDKVGQKYLLESISAPLINSYVFYDKKSALDWVANTSFPKVFKLRTGAGSENVHLVKTKNKAEKLIGKAFNKGFTNRNRSYIFKERLWWFQRDKTLKTFLEILKGVFRLLVRNNDEIFAPKEMNYVYFQDFIPQNDCDIRVIVIGMRAFAIKRMIRENDFRASGSGFIKYSPKEIPIECIEIAFDISYKLKAQCLAYDFVFLNNEAKLIEISYGFSRKGYLDCEGYWDNSLNWIEGRFTPEYFMIEDIVEDIHSV